MGSKLGYLQSKKVTSINQGDEILPICDEVLELNIYQYFQQCSIGTGSNTRNSSPDFNSDSNNNSHLFLNFKKSKPNH
jgi:hypothetical protein